MGQWFEGIETTRSALKACVTRVDVEGISHRKHAIDFSDRKFWLPRCEERRRCSNIHSKESPTIRDRWDETPNRSPHCQKIFHRNLRCCLRAVCISECKNLVVRFRKQSLLCRIKSIDRQTASLDNLRLQLGWGVPIEFVGVTLNPK